MTGNSTFDLLIWVLIILLIVAVVLTVIRRS